MRRRLVPSRHVFELDRKDGALEAVHARVPADLVVVVAAAHAVLAQHAGALGEVVGIGGDHAGIACGAQVLGGIEAEGGGVAQARRRSPLANAAPQAWAASSMSS